MEIKMLEKIFKTMTTAFSIRDGSILLKRNSELPVAYQRKIEITDAGAIWAETKCEYNNRLHSFKARRVKFSTDHVETGRKTTGVFVTEKQSA